jgi:hypothetical protein
MLTFNNLINFNINKCKYCIDLSECAEMVAG